MVASTTWPQLRHIHFTSTSETKSLSCSISSANRPNRSPWVFSMPAIMEKVWAISGKPSSWAVLAKPA